MIIDCDNCLVREIACGDCVVSVLIGSTTPASIEPGSNGSQLNAEEARVIDLLSSRGMVPPLRFTDLEDSQAQKSRSG